MQQRCKLRNPSAVHYLLDKSTPKTFRTVSFLKQRDYVHEISLLMWAVTTLTPPRSEVHALAKSALPTLCTIYHGNDKERYSAGSCCMHRTSTTTIKITVSVYAVADEEVREDRDVTVTRAQYLVSSGNRLPPTLQQAQSFPAHGFDSALEVFPHLRKRLLPNHCQQPPHSCLLCFMAAEGRAPRCTPVFTSCKAVTSSTQASPVFLKHPGEREGARQRRGWRSRRTSSQSLQEAGNTSRTQAEKSCCLGTEG